MDPPAFDDWSSIRIAGHQCCTYEPKTPSPHSYTILYLHDEDGGRLEDHPTYPRLFDEYGLRCLAPVTGESWWTDRIHRPFDAETSSERYLLEHVLPWLDENWNVRPPQIALLGVGMGGQGALRLAYKRPHLFPVVAAVSPAIDYHFRMEEGSAALRAMYRDPEQARQDTATLHIHPLNWPRHQWFACDPADYQRYESADRLRMKLYSLGVPYTADLETSVGGGDYGEYVEAMAKPALSFIVEALEKERRRAL
jgi:S-formylglutathione hydrolase